MPHNLLLRAFDSAGAPVADTLTAQYSTDGGATFSSLSGAVTASGQTGIYYVVLTDAETDPAFRYNVTTATSGNLAVVDAQSLPTEAPTSGATALSAPVSSQTRNWSALARVTKTSDGQDVDFTLSVVGGATLETKTITVSETDFDNSDSSLTVTAGADFDVASTYVDGDLQIAVAPSGGSTATVEASALFAPDSELGCAPRWFDSAHSGPTATVYNGQLWEMASSAGEAKRFLAVNRQPAGELFQDVPASDRESADKYHSASALAVADGVAVAGFCDHNEQAYIVRGRTPEELANSPAVAITDNADTATYLQFAGDPSPGGKLWVLTRVDNELHLVEISGLSTDSPTIVTDVLADSTQRNYPRGLELHHQEDGSPLLLFRGQSRDGARWGATYVGAYDPATRQCYNARGETSGGTTLGTSGSPKLTSANVTTAAATDTGSLVASPENVNIQRYSLPAAVNVHTWNDSTKLLRYGVVYYDGDDITADAAAGTGQCRMVVWDGVTRVASDSGIDILSADASVSYRINGVCRFLQGSPSTLEVTLGYRAAAFTVADEYNQFGADTWAQWTFEIGGVINSSQLVAATQKRRDLTFSSTFGTEVRAVGGDSDGLIFCEAIANSHVDETQGVASRTRYSVPERTSSTPDLTTIETNASTAATQATTAATQATAASTTASAIQTTVQPDIALRVTTSGTSLVVDAYRALGNITNAGLRVDRISTGEYEPGIPVVPGAVGAQTFQQTYANKSDWADERLLLTLTGDIDGTDFTIVSYHEPVEQTLSSVGTGNTVTVEDPDDRHHVWKFPRSGPSTTAGNRVTCKVGASFTAQFDLDGVIDKEAVVSGTPTAASTGPTAGTAVVHASRRKVNVPLSGIDTVGTYTVTLTYTTTTSQTLVVSGTLVVEAA